MDIARLSDQQLQTELERSTQVALEHVRSDRFAHARLAQVELAALQKEADRRRDGGRIAHSVNR